MKLTNGEIFSARDPLQTLLGMKFPVGVSFKLAKLASAINDELRAIDSVRNGLIEKYGAPNSAGRMAVEPEIPAPDGTMAPNPAFTEFVGEFSKLMEIEVEVVAQKVKLPLEVDGKPLEVEPSLLMALERFVEV